eukprot:1157743-Pelagomonas_calceolata.AAC.3
MLCRWTSGRAGAPSPATSCDQPRHAALPHSRLVGKVRHPVFQAGTSTTKQAQLRLEQPQGSSSWVYQVSKAQHFQARHICVENFHAEKASHSHKNTISSPEDTKE